MPSGPFSNGYQVATHADLLDGNGVSVAGSNTTRLIAGRSPAGNYFVYFESYVDGPYSLTFSHYVSPLTPPIPIPPALPLFASGLGVMAWLARRRKRKAAAEA